MNKVNVIAICWVLFVLVLVSVAATASYYESKICESKGGIYLHNDCLCIKPDFIIK